MSWPRDLPVLALIVGLCLPWGGCGRDPILDAAEEIEAQEGTPGAGGAPGRPADPSPGSPDAPAVGAPGVPAPARAADPPPGTPAEPVPGKPGSAPPIDGPSVAITGEIRLADYDLGTVRIDIFDGDQRNLDGPRPSVVAVAQLERPGAFTIQVPVSATQVWIGAFVDEDLNGRPGPQDPSGWYVGNPVSTEGGADGIVLQLERQPPPRQHGL